MTPRALIPALLALLVAVPAASGGGPAPLQPEANATAAGDIPDNQVFLVFRSPAGYSMKYPEGWAQRGSGDAVVFRDKNNIVRIVVAAAPAPTKALVGRELGRDRVRIEGGRRKFVFPLGVG
jgi:hypothetical protein